MSLVLIAAVLTFAAILYTLFVRAQDIPEPAPANPVQHLESRNATEGAEDARQDEVERHVQVDLPAPVIAERARGRSRDDLPGYRSYGDRRRNAGKYQQWRQQKPAAMISRTS